MGQQLSSLSCPKALLTMSAMLLLKLDMRLRDAADVAPSLLQTDGFARLSVAYQAFVNANLR
jgi:hypothetical protein